MSIATDSEGAVVTSHKHGGHEFRFGKLTMRDLATIQASMPKGDTSFGQVYRWLTSPAGRLSAIVAAAQKFDPMFTEGQCDDFGIDVCFRVSEVVVSESFGTLLTEKSAEGNEVMGSVTPT